MWWRREVQPSMPCAGYALRMGDVTARAVKRGTALSGAALASRRRSGGGGQLPKALRVGAEREWGVSLARVRVHPDSPLPGLYGASAVARGTELHFRPGGYRPQTSEGRALALHELAHVGQQAAGETAGARRAADGSVAEPRLEAKADRFAGRQLGGEFGGHQGAPDPEFSLASIPSSAPVQCNLLGRAFRMGATLWRGPIRAEGPWKNLVKNGVSVLMSEAAASNFPLKNGILGRTENLGGLRPAQFVMPTDTALGLLREAKGDPRALEDRLGLGENSLTGQRLAVMHVKEPLAHGLRKPSTRDAGASDKFVERQDGEFGETSGGVPEACTNPVPLETSYVASDGELTEFVNVEVRYIEIVQASPKGASSGLERESRAEGQRLDPSSERGPDTVQLEEFGKGRARALVSLAEYKHGTVGYVVHSLLRDALQPFQCPLLGALGPCLAEFGAAEVGLFYEGRLDGAGHMPKMLAAEWTNQNIEAFCERDTAYFNSLSGFAWLLGQALNTQSRASLMRGRRDRELSPSAGGGGLGGK